MIVIFSAAKKNGSDFWHDLKRLRTKKFYGEKYYGEMYCDEYCVAKLPLWMHVHVVGQRIL